MAQIPYSLVGMAHIGAALGALGSGAWVLLTRKGTGTHVRVGWVYVGSLVFVDSSAMFIRHLSGRYNLFHALALLSLFMVVGGVAQVVNRRRWRRWLWRHYQYMCWSYAALVAGAFNEATTRVAVLRDLSARTGGALAVAGSAMVIGVAAVLILKNQRRLLAAFGTAADGGPK